MAEDIAFTVKVDGVEKNIESVKELKNAIKQAKDEQLKAATAFGEGSKEYVKAAAKVSALKDKVEDLGDSTKSLAGSGVERASAGFSQLGEGLKNLDFDKVKVGLTAMKSALAAVGIGLIIQAVMYLVENFDSLSKGTGFLAKALRVVGDIVTGLIEIFTDFMGMTSDASRALDKMGEDMKTSADKGKEALASQTAEYDRLISVAKASGKSTIDLEIAKQHAIIETNKAIVEQGLNFIRAGGVVSDEQRKMLLEAASNIHNAVAAEKVITLTANTEKLAIAKKHSDDMRQIAQTEQARLADIENAAIDKAEAKALKAKQDAIKAQDDLRAYNKTADKQNQDIDNTDSLAKAQLNVAKNREDLDAKIALLTAKRDIELQNETLTNDQKKIIEQNYLNEVEDLNKASEQRKKAEQKAALDGGLQLTAASLQGAQQLTDLFFEYKKSTLQKGSAEELAAAKKQFQVNKALQISMAVISGVQGVIAAYSSGSAIPIIGAVAGPAFAILAGIAAAANIAKIARAKFGDTGGGGGGSAPASAPSIPIPSPPGINTQQNNTNSTFDDKGNKTNVTPTINIKATVGVDEIADKQNRVKVLEKQSTF